MNPVTQTKPGTVMGRSSPEPATPIGAAGGTRRQFIGRAAATFGAALFAGCASNPVTGEPQLMLVSEEREIDIDRRRSPHQFSADYGVTDDAALNDYLDGVGRRMAAASHRPGMPYSFRAVDATSVNAYTFPAGSVAVTRGILIELDDEAQLAALLGHEIGHVNARHAAERMSKSMVIEAAVEGAAGVIGYADKRLESVAYGLGGWGAGLLLAAYSRANERQADALGMSYMVARNHNPVGMVRLMEMLTGMNNTRPGVLQTMFATHPMSGERLATARRRAENLYPQAADFPVGRDRYLDATARLRKIRQAIVRMQRGEERMEERKFADAARYFGKAIKIAPDDYAPHVMMAKAQLALNKPAEAKRYADAARDIKPGEGQAIHLGGMARLAMNDFDGAHTAFVDYEMRLSGNPNTLFLQGFSLEAMGRRAPAAERYFRYLRLDRSSEQAEYAAARLVEWGYIEGGP
jgi:predicted Zn-dependent protease